ncbi:hypothetical protein F5884DRAFT_404411 [Xylogone sp. PMI_703]|nr:hypothetical protein F5884DRAFT_404411 [Xylogone sp. PMI_703]
MSQSKQSVINRQRASKACIPCHNSKRKCAGGIPCSYCLRLRRASICRYDDGQSPLAERENNLSIPVPSNHNRSPRHHASPRRLSKSIARSTTSATPVDEDTTTEDTVPDFLSIHSSESSPLFSPRFLRSQRGNRVHVGSTSIMAFLPFLRNVVKQSYGPSHFTEARENGTMLESETALDSPSPLLQDTTTIIQRKELLQTFFTATSGLLDLFDTAELFKAIDLLNAPPQPHLSIRELCALAIAIGARCHQETPELRACEVAHFDLVRSHLNIENIGDIKLDNIRLYVLAAFYMFCSCNRNIGYVYLGLAARFGHVMGLHYGISISSSSKADKEVKCVWKSLRLLETLVSSFLGRPSATLRPPYDHNTENVQMPLHEQISRSAPVEYISRLLDILNDSSDNFCCPNVTNIASIKESMTKLSDWSSKLPTSLRKASRYLLSSLSYQDQIIANMHVACFYYYNVILITKPFLVYQLLIDRSNDSVTDTRKSPPKEPPTRDVRDSIKILAKECEDAAVFMISACNDVFQEDLMLDNMCLVQAFVFIAALLLGLVMFADDYSDSDVDRSLKDAIKIMNRLSGRSQQAKHYSCILGDMYSDIVSYQNQRASSRRETSSRSVKKLTELTTNWHPQPGETLPDSELLHNQPSNLNSTATYSQHTSFPNLSFSPGTQFDDTEMEISAAGLDFFSFPFWDETDMLGTNFGSN